MNIYSVSGVASFTRIGECKCCGQDWEREDEKNVSVEVETAETDEDCIRNLALEKAQAKLKRDYATEDIDSVQWGSYRNFPRRPKTIIVLVREVSEAELMMRAGAPMLPMLEGVR